MALHLRTASIATPAIGNSPAHRAGRATYLRALLIVGVMVVPALPSHAQGISTGAIRGTVRNEAGAPLEGAYLHVRNSSTGHTREARVTNGRFLVYGVEIGGPYIIEARFLGYVPQRTPPLRLALGVPLDVDFVLESAPSSLAEVRVQATRSAPSGATTVPDSLLARLPTPNRNFLDFVALAPHVTTKVGLQRNGLSAAGANFRYNTYLLDGAEERFVNSNVSTAHVGSSVPLDAVKEYQVLVAPFDVRFGDFAGAMVNTVTRSGTNAVHGSAFNYWRSDRWSRGEMLSSDSLAFDRWQYGFSIGGPIVRDRVHFFIAPELERRSSPATGPFVGQSRDAVPSLPVAEADVTRFVEIMRGYGLAPGDGGAAEERDALTNLFVRLDADVPRFRSRASTMLSHARAEELAFSRADTFYLSSAGQTSATRLRLISLRLDTDISRTSGAHNELIVSHSEDRAEQVPAARQPLIRVLVPGTGGTTVPLVAGAAENAHGRHRDADAVRIRNAFTLPLGGRHVLVLGASAERFRIRPGGVVRGYGVWTFPSLDAFEQGAASGYEVRSDLGSASARLHGWQYAAFLGDEWQPSPRLTVSLGFRADMLHITSRAPYSAAVDSIFGRRTDARPPARVHLSPRLGAAWNVDATGRTVVRGGAGVFTGRPPLAWIHSAISNYGIGIGVLRCGSLPDDDGPPPPFETDYRNPPRSCASGPSPLARLRGEVNLLDANLRMAEALRTSLEWDQALPWRLRLTTAWLHTRYLSDFAFANINLQGPQGVDAFGRVMYGTIATSGIPAVAVRARQFAEVIELRNTSRNRANQLSTRLERRFDNGFAASASYTWSRVRDVQSPSRVNQRGLTMWGDARATSGRHDDLALGTSLNDLPHRVVTALTYTAPWTRWPTALSLYYVGESGSPFTYLAYGESPRGDLNADGSNLNDPIYVPRSAFDENEIRFNGVSPLSGADNSPTAQAARIVAQQAAFEQFVASTPCVRRQRGRILERNSCRDPWSNTSVASLRQGLPIGAHRLDVELDVINMLNLFNSAWGRYRVSTPAVLAHVGQTGGSPGTSQPVFRFDPARARVTTLALESVFQLQLAVRYRF